MMKPTFKTRAGFTLVELLVSIAIFVIFLGVISLSYIGIIRSQRQANQVRAMYSDVRSFMEALSEDMRLGTIDYDCYEVNGSLTNSCENKDLNVSGTPPNQSTYLAIVNKDQTQKVIYWYDKSFNELKVIRYHGDFQNAQSNDITQGAPPDAGYAAGKDTIDPATDGISVFSNLVKVSNVVFSVNPPVNPYLSANYSQNQYQFQPKVTMTITIENATTNVAPFHLNFQTTLSSRVYSRSK